MATSFSWETLVSAASTSDLKSDHSPESLVNWVFSKELSNSDAVEKDVTDVRGAVFKSVRNETEDFADGESHA
jgi:hypothetical protein